MGRRQRRRDAFGPQNDPLELTNLAANPAYAETIALMKRYLKQLPDQ